jgi:hypothetical protein
MRLASDGPPGERLRLIQQWLRGDQLDRGEAPAQGADPEPAPAANTAPQVTKPGQAEGTRTLRQQPLADAGAPAYHEPPTRISRQISGGFDRGYDRA